MIEKMKHDEEYENIPDTLYIKPATIDKTPIGQKELRKILKQNNSYEDKREGLKFWFKVLGQRNIEEKQITKEKQNIFLNFIFLAKL